MLLRKTMLISLALALLWIIFSVSLASYLSSAAPQAALFLNVNQPDALLNRAEKLLGLNLRNSTVEPIMKAAVDFEADRDTSSSTTIQDEVEETTVGKEDLTETSDTERGAIDADSLAKINQWAEQALAHDPLNAKALRMLGQVAYASGNINRGDDLMEASAQRSLRESLALYSMVRKNYRERNYTEALEFADALLRTRNSLTGDLMPMLGKIAEDPDARSHLQNLLSAGPSWARLFFEQLPKHITDARTPLGIFLALKESPTPPSDADRLKYLELLVRKDFHELAYYTWLQFLPPEELVKTGYVFNGGFDLAPSGAPFDWNWRAGRGATVELTPRPENPDDAALLVKFGPGRSEFSGVQQLMLLPPGDFRMSAEYKSDLASERGLKWVVTCNGSREPLGESVAVGGVDNSWKELEFVFSIPDEGCPAQTLQLKLDARSESEKFAIGSVWYDAVLIARNSDSEAPKQ